MKQDSKKAETPKSIKGAKILLVEDNELNQLVATEILRMAGLDVFVASNGRKALEAIASTNFDLVLMDIQMPEMDGYEATRLIRQNKQYRNLPIIAMTAHTFEEEKEKCLKAGMNDHLSKPIQSALLFQTLARWITPGEREIVVQTAEFSKQENSLKVLNKIEGIDIQSAIDRVGGNANFYLGLLISFREKYQEVADLLKEAVAKGEWEAVKNLAHTVQGLAANLGAQRLSSASADLESVMEKSPGKNQAVLINDFASALDELFHEIEKLEYHKPVMAGNDPEASLDHEIVAPLLLKLQGMLKNNQYVSINCLESMQKLIKKQEYQPELDRLEKQIQEFEYEAALKSLNDLSKQLKI